MTRDGVILEPRPSVKRIEEKAADCLRTCCEALGLDRLPFPVPVDLWIEHPLGLTFGIQDLRRWGSGVLGVAIPRRKTILVSDTIRNEARFRFTCAHELGHVVLHSRIKTAGFRDTDPEEETGFDRYEWQANRFAAAFLMPLPHLLWAVVDAAGPVRKSDPLADLLTGRDDTEGLWRTRVVPQLARRFGVSRTAAVIRLTSVRLSDGKPLLFPAMANRILMHSPGLFDQRANA